jgi:hypothetical protein
VSFHLHVAGRAPGNRGVSRSSILVVSGDLYAGHVEAYPEEEGGPWGKHGFPHGSEAQPSDDVEGE